MRKISDSEFESGSQDYAAWQRASTLSTVLSDASQSITGFQDLAGSAVGNSAGEGSNAAITLDFIAAGHGWYVDPTPLDNTDDYLPTSNPNVWQAKAGTDAAGKMDMLSVLLHEYGHALGLVHSADGRDFMATTLQPGERRLPSSEELTLMSQLVAQLKADSSATPTDPANPDAPSSPTAPLPGLPFAGLGLFALGRLRSDRYGIQTLFAPNGSVLAAVPQYEVAANTTLTNGQFNTSNGSLNSAQGWATEGSVAIEAGAATLNESATQQTRLNQVFIVGPQDRYLSFTLSNLALIEAATGPDDAFEVALLNANTGASLSAQTSDIGLTHTDALLNLQASGAELAASGVTHVTNADGSRTYLVDLAGIAAGTAVNLSFDLIGFGSTAPNLGSHATVSNVRLMGMAQTRDDSISTFEDTVARIIALANDIDANQAGMAPVIVAAPQHGLVVVNPDSTFSYTPAQDYFGTDSFTYRLSNGVVDSNVSTVTLTITPVNDAPVAADLSGPQTTLAEDSMLTIDLLAGAIDAEGAPLAASIVSGPLHGSLVQGSDVTVTYTAEANFFGLDSFTYRVSDGEADSSLASVSLTVTAVNDAPVASSAETDQRARFKFKNFLKQKHHLAQARQA
ncbi:MAG: tandem-95 repeat protein [Rhodoferax sp.]|nr:tandem-95 repeat protein [Rhodoferax sp.]